MARPRAPATSRADTIWSVGAAALAVVLVVFGVVVLLLAQQDVRNARAQLASALSAEARVEHRSPRDPRVLAAVSRQLPRDVRLVPSSSVLTTGRVEVVSRRLHTTSGLCLILPERTTGRIEVCHRASGRRTGSRGRTLAPARR